ncbi:MAG: UvrB/UvrC motif-containing protein [Phycisphaerales bacterium]
MKRKCDRCDQEATVHEVVIKNGQKMEKHLCESCAQVDGIAMQSHPSINELITNYTITQSGGSGPQQKCSTTSCQTCGMSYAQFRKHGLLGCSDCYATFEESVGPLIERAHEGATHHVGKRPRRAGGLVDRQQRISALRKQLHAAIASEQYEEAALIRDQLLEFTDGVGDEETV